MTRKQFHAALDELRPRVLATEPTSKARKLNRETRRWLRNCTEEGGWRPEATEGMLAGLRRVILTEIAAGLEARDFHGFSERVAELHEPVAASRRPRPPKRGGWRGTANPTPPAPRIPPRAHGRRHRGGGVSAPS